MGLGASNSNRNHFNTLEISVRSSMKLLAKYTKIRSYLLSKASWQKVFAFLRLPELKLVKTCGFIASILL